MKFIIFTPRYKETTGGTIVLHKLAKVLNKMGHEAYIWNFQEPRTLFTLLINRVLRIFKIKREIKARKLFNRREICPYSGLVKASNDDLKDSIVVYPEIIAGNPLGAEKVVRWLLYKPGAHTGVIDYSPKDLFFYYLKEYDYPQMNKFPDNQLFVADYFLDIYKQVNFGPRKGSCFMVRKGIGRKLNMHPKDAIQVDGLTHRELAEVFNQCEYFFSYDLYTMYSAYASICGCKSVVLPPAGMRVEEWIHNESGRNGVAFGLQDVERAEKTRPFLLSQIHNREKSNENSVSFFVERCKRFFQL